MIGGLGSTHGRGMERMLPLAKEIILRDDLGQVATKCSKDDGELPSAADELRNGVEE